MHRLAQTHMLYTRAGTDCLDTQLHTHLLWGHGCGVGNASNELFLLGLERGGGVSKLGQQRDGLVAGAGLLDVWALDLWVRVWVCVGRGEGV